MARPGAERSGRSGRRGRRTFTVRGDGDRAVDGATVVRAVVHARLLGLRLLTLDARVVVAPAEIAPTSLDLMTPLAVADDTSSRADVVERPTQVGPALPQPLSDRSSPRAAANGGVSRARELLAEGTYALAKASEPA